MRTPSDEYRRVLLDQVVHAFARMLIVVVPLLVFADITGIDATVRTESYVAIAIFVVAALALDRLGNRVSTATAGSLMVLMLVALIVLTGTRPDTVVVPRFTMSVATIPIMMSSFVITARASFVVAGLCSAIVAATNLAVSDTVPVIEIASFVAAAYISYFVARALDRSLASLRSRNTELQDLNTNLDRRVEARTHQLVEARAESDGITRRSAAIWESLSEPVLLVDHELRVELANPAGIALLADAGPIVGEHLHELMGDQVEANDQQLLIDLITERAATALPAVPRITWGGRTLGVRTSLLPGEPDSPPSTIVALTDYTAEAALEAISADIAAVISHEFMSPLTVIVGHAELILHSADLPEEAYRASLEAIQSGARQLAALGQGLLEQSRTDTFTARSGVALVDMHDVVLEAADAARPAIIERGLSFEVSLADAPLTVLGDRMWLGRAVANLLANATSYTDAGSISVEASKLGGEVRVSVADTGIGIADADLTRSFERFVSVGDPSRRDRPSNGLGLFLVKSVADAHNGHLRATSKVGQGSTFVLTLPCAEG